jgi:hypothetical protein
VVGEGDSDDSVSKFFESDDSGSLIVWTEGSSEEDLDYFAALDVAAVETPPRVMGAEVDSGVSAGRRRRRAVAIRRVGDVAEPPELFQLKCLSHASGAVTHLNRNNPSVPQI